MGIVIFGVVEWCREGERFRFGRWLRVRTCTCRVNIVVCVFFLERVFFGRFVLLFGLCLCFCVIVVLGFILFFCE